MALSKRGRPISYTKDLILRARRKVAYNYRREFNT
jgi:hypothetical protein